MVFFLAFSSFLLFFYSPEKGKRLAARPKPVADSGGLWVIDIAGSGFQSSENLNCFSLWFYDNEKKEQVEITVSENSLQTEVTA